MSLFVNKNLLLTDVSSLIFGGKLFVYNKSPWRYPPPSLPYRRHVFYGWSLMEIWSLISIHFGRIWHAVLVTSFWNHFCIILKKKSLFFCLENLSQNEFLQNFYNWISKAKISMILNRASQFQFTHEGSVQLRLSR